MTLPCAPLDCPQPDNYAAIAKQLHETALQAESCIFEQEILLRSMVNRPSMVKTTTATITGILISVDETVTGGSQSYVFNNTGMTSNTGPDNSTDIWEFLGEGMYEIGWTCTAIASAAVTDNSVRIFRIEQLRPDPTSSTGFDVIQETGYTLFETNTGNGTDVSFCGTFRIVPGDLVNLKLFHDNASTMNISTGMYVWMCKVSDVSLRQVL